MGIKKSLKIRPNQPAYLDSLGWVYYKQGKLSAAKKYISRAADMLRDPVVLDHLGDVYYKLGEREKAKNSAIGETALKRTAMTVESKHRQKQKATQNTSVDTHSLILPKLHIESKF